MDWRGRGQGCGCGFRQPRTPERGEGSETSPNRNSRNEGNDQVVTALNHVIAILEHLTER